jgi:hypothetical protein
MATFTGWSLSSDPTEPSERSDHLALVPRERGIIAAADALDLRGKRVDLYHVLLLLSAGGT